MDQTEDSEARIPSENPEAMQPDQEIQAQSQQAIEPVAKTALDTPGKPARRYGTVFNKIINIFRPDDNSLDGSDSEEAQNSQAEDNVNVCDSSCELSHIAIEGARHSLEQTSARQTPTHEAPNTVETPFAPEALYTSLRSWETRILTIDPGEADEPLVTSLVVCALLATRGVVLSKTRRRVEYDAISYCWGQSPPNARMNCNGFSFPLTEHLHTALKNLRRAAKKRHVWIDAICINQLVPSEKAAQVRNMLLIYKKAHNVVVWLGEEHPLTRWCMSAIDSMPEPDNSDGTIESDLQLCQQHSQLISEACSDLLDRTWFFRVWVQQEVWATKNDTLIFLCGSVKITRSELHTVADFADILDPSGGYYDTYTSMPSVSPATRAQIEGYQESGIDPPTEVRTVRDGNETLKCQLRNGDILEIMLRSQGRECSDSRDYVYGLVGMSTIILDSSSEERDRPNVFKIDYTIPASQVFVNLARYIVKRDAWLSINYLHSESEEPAIIDDTPLPSWCPDWSDFDIPKVFAILGYEDVSYFGRIVHLVQNDREPAEIDSDLSRLFDLQMDSMGHELPWHILRLRGLLVGEDTTPDFKVMVKIPPLVKAKMPRGLSRKLSRDLSVPITSRSGDVFVLFENDPVPVCIRSVPESTNQWQFVGACYSKSVLRFDGRLPWQKITSICREADLFEIFDLV